MSGGIGKNYEEHLIHMRLVLRDGTDEEEVVSRFRERLKNCLESLGAKSPNIQIEFVQSIERHPRQMGKLKVIQSNVRKVAT